MSEANIPFLDLVTPHKELKEELLAAVSAALDTAGFIGGPAVQGFEQAFAEYCQAAECIGVNSGTDALRFAFIAAGVAPGQSMITVPNTFIATTEAISQAGAVPLFVDIDEATYNMDPVKVRELIENECDFDPATKTLTHRKTKTRVTALVPVHLYGQMADMDALIEIADKYGLFVFEDACQAHGAEYFSKKQNRWCRAGSMGKAAAFSFYPGKNLGACGEGGAVTTNDRQLAANIRRLRDHGQAKKYYHDVEGYNGRLDAIQASMLHVKLGHLGKWTENRRKAAGVYKELLEGVEGVGLPFEPTWSNAVYHLFVVRVADRDEFMKALAAVGIATGIHYPIPLHLQKAYAGMGLGEGTFPVAERVAGEIVSLPMFPQLTRAQQERVSQEVGNFLSASNVGV